MSRLIPSSVVEAHRLGDETHDVPVGEARAASESAETNYLEDVRRGLQLHGRLALGIALAGVALAVVYFLTQWQVYTAESLVYVHPAAPRVLDSGTDARWPYDGVIYSTYIDQQMQNASSTEVLSGALRKLGPGGWRKGGESEQAAIERLRRAVEVARVGTGYQFSITARASGAALAADLSNAVAASYIESASREQKGWDAERLKMLGEERERVQSELAADRTEQQALNKQLGVAAVGSATPNHYDEDTSHLREELITARTAHDVAAARLTSMGGEHAGSGAALAAEAEEVVANDTGLASLKSTLNQQRAQLTARMANLTPNHPQYKLDAEQLARIDGSIAKMSEDLRAKASARLEQRLRTDLERTAGVETRLNGQLGQMAAAAGGASFKMQRAADLAADIARLQARYTAVDGQWRNLSIEAQAPGTASLAAAAAVPLHRAKSSVVRNALMLAFAGLLLGILAAVGAHRLDPRVYIAADVQRLLGVAPLAVLPDSCEVSEGVAEEHLLRLSSSFEYAHQQGRLKSFLFTGAGAGVGVTTVANGVRSILKIMGNETVLVDASGAPPPPLGTSGQETHSEESSSQLVTQRASRSSALRRQVAEESESGDEGLVLTDSAPLAVSAETQYLARFVDCAVVVIESGVTTRAQLREAADTLERLDVAAVEFVLNRVGMKMADPAFRRSVRAIEEHLRAQSYQAQKYQARSYQSQGYQAQDRAFARDAEERGQSPIAPPRQESAPQQTKTAVATEPAAVPVLPAPAQPESVLPELFFPELPAAQPLPVVRRGRFMETALAESLRPAAEVAAAPAPAAEVRAPRLDQAAPAAAAAAPPAQSWEDVSEQTEETRPEPVQATSVEAELPAAPAPENETAPQAELFGEGANGASRLSGLRNLLFSLGVKNLNRSRKPEAREPEDELPISRRAAFADEAVAEDTIQVQPDSAVHVRSAAPAPVAARQAATNPAAANFAASTPAAPISDALASEVAASVSPTLLTAPPEFLPPTPIAEANSRESARAKASFARHDRLDRLDGEDDVHILPSWHGQYRRKSKT